MVGTYSIAQTPNSLPNSGNVGIGTTTPSAKLQVKGSVRIDSSLTVKKSMVVQKNTQLNGTLQVNNTFFLPNLVDSTATGSTVLMIDENGKVERGGNLKDRVYAAIETPVGVDSCEKDINGNFIYNLPSWERDYYGMFLLQHCTRPPRLGIGVKPSATLHIRTKEGSSVPPLLIDCKKMNSGDSTKLLQLDEDGLLHTREILIDAQEWADFVFQKDYKLTPLEEVADFIKANNHLPGIPSAKYIKQEGLNVEQHAKSMLQKVEELTLYAIQQKKQLDIQKETIHQLELRLNDLEKQFKQLTQTPNSTSR